MVVGPRLLDTRRVAFAGVEGLFLRGSPRRWRARHMVGTLTRRPCVAATWVQSSSKVISGSCTWPRGSLPRRPRGVAVGPPRAVSALRSPCAGGGARVFRQRHADPEQVGEGTLGAEPPCVGLENLLA
jgi:hypothetical protein